MVKDEVFERILENKERAFVLTNSCTPESILTWNDVERYLNDNTHNTEITIIGDNKQKKDVYKSTETSGTPSDVIYHLAAQSGGYYSLENSYEDCLDNSLGTHNIVMG